MIECTFVCEIFGCPHPHVKRRTMMSERPLEYCFICDEPTGRAGQGEDSLYCDECDKGPYCPDCFRKHHESDVKVAALLDVVLDCVNFLADLNTNSPSQRSKSLHKRAYTAHSKAKEM